MITQGFTITVGITTSSFIDNVFNRGLCHQCIVYGTHFEVKIVQESL